MSDFAHEPTSVADEANNLLGVATGLYGAIPGLPGGTAVGALGGFATGGYGMANSQGAVDSVVNGVGLAGTAAGLAPNVANLFGAGALEASALYGTGAGSALAGGGAATTGGAVATSLGVGGALAGAAGAGWGIGTLIDHGTGWLSSAFGGDGRNMHERIGEDCRATNDWVTGATGSSTLGTIADVAVNLGESTIGAGLGLGALATAPLWAPVAGAAALGNWIFGD